MDMSESVSNSENSEASEPKNLEESQELEADGRGRASSNTDRDTSHEQFVSPLQSSAMPSIIQTHATLTVANNIQASQVHTEPVLKMERSESLDLTVVEREKAHFESDSSSVGRERTGFVGEEPLEIQCGENTALLYVSKLCQGSKGPCILFNNEWLTPNELQYISGRETAKDWKRSIRFKGKSLKSLIARGLIKVHPPICDCLGCRISSPVNRGRLASKCGVTPSSPRSRKRDAVKSLSCWSPDDLKAATTHRHYSTSDIECMARHTASNGLEFKDRRESSSSATSECSEGHDDSPFSPVVKRPRSITPDDAEEKVRTLQRRASDSSLAFFPSHAGGEGHNYDPRTISMHRELSARYLMSGERSVHVQDIQGDPKDKGSRGTEEKGPRGPSDYTLDARSAFRAVHQDGIPPGVTLAEVSPEALQREMAIRVAKLHKQKPQSPGRKPPQFLPPFSQYVTAVSPTHTSPRLIPDPLLLAGPASSIYHPALRGAGYPVLSQLQQNLMQYRLLSPPGAGNQPQSPLAGLSLQSKFIVHDPVTMATCSVTSAHASDKKPRLTENGIYPKRRRLSTEQSENDNSSTGMTSDEPTEIKKEEDQFNGDKHHVSVIHKSPVESPGSVDGHTEVRVSPCGKEQQRLKPHKLIPTLRLGLDENILRWTVSDVCQFVSSLSGIPEVVNEFKEQSIDGQSLILLQEDHLLNRMGMKLGPALKIQAHIRKIMDKMQASEDTSDSG